MEDNFSTDGAGVWGWWRAGGYGSGSNASDGERWGAADEASLSCPPLTSCCAARFLTGRGLRSVQSGSLGTPVLKKPVLKNLSKEEIEHNDGI